MSWNDYVTSKLMSTVDSNQHKLENVLEHGALIGCNDGVTWAASAGFTVGKNKGTVEGSGEVEIDEFANLPLTTMETAKKLEESDSAKKKST